jgi:RNA recognition motif-containing protein
MSKKTLKEKPCETLYIKNLNEKIKIDELKEALNKEFSQYGEIIEIRVRNTIRLKGQAFISFKTKEESSKAKKNLNDKLFLNKKLIIEFAKTPSDSILLLQGKLTENQKKIKDLSRKRKRDEFYENLKNEIEKEKNNNINNNEMIINAKDSNENEISIKINPEEVNKSLFVQGLKNSVTNQMLIDLFNSLSGFKEVKYFPTKGICFVEYDTVENATNALLKYDKFDLGNDCILRVSFSKK